jgi:DnaJ like chaperone protein
MSWLGKLVGGAFGFLMAGPIGAALGVALGHQVDQGELDFSGELRGLKPEAAERLQRAFFLSLFQVMGHIAKADGRISEAEIKSAREIIHRLQLSADLKLMAMRLFNEGKQDRFALDHVIDPLLAELKGHPLFKRKFVSLLVESALADGVMRASQERVLLEVCERLGFSRYEYYGIRTRLETERRFGGFRAPPRPRMGNAESQGESSERRWNPSHAPENLIHEAYAVLGLSSIASASEVKRAYRRLINRHHPDKLTAKGASVEAIQNATQETQKIQKAYEAISRILDL